MRGTFRSLRSRNYRLFFIGQTLSLIGTWMQSVAMSWLVYRMTGSEFLLGVVTFSSQIPMFLASPFAGVVTDRFDRRRLLVVTQSLALVQAIALAALVFADKVHVSYIIALSVFVGIVNALDTPTRQSFVPELVEDRKDLGNVIALNSTQFNTARLIGPALAGLAIHAFGEGVCFLINAVSYLAVIVALLMMRVPKHVKHTEPFHPIQDLREGATYAWHMGPIRNLLLLIAVASFAGGSYQVLLPVFAREIYHGDARTLGILYSAIAIGALLAAYMLANRRSVVGLGRWVVISSGIFAIMLAAFGFTKTEWLGLPILVAMGFGTMKHMGATNTLIQTVVKNEMRGRVMAFYAMAFIGTAPFGSLASGAISSRIGPTWTLVGAGAISLCATFAFFRSLPDFRKVLRVIYEDLGILENSPPAG